MSELREKLLGIQEHLASRDDRDVIGYAIHEIDAKRIYMERADMHAIAATRLKAENDRLEKENSAFAAGLCPTGYGDEHGHYRCREIDRLREQLVKRTDALKKIARYSTVICECNACTLARMAADALTDEQEPK